MILLRRLAMVGGGGLLVAAFLVPIESVPAGGRSLEGWSLAVLGVATAISAVGLGRGCVRASALVGLLLIGIGGQIGLTDPLWLQSLRLGTIISGEGLARVFAGAILLQAVVVGGLCWGRRRELLRLRWPVPGATRAAAALLLFVGSAAHATLYVPSGDFRRYAIEMTVAALLLTLNLLHLHAIVTAAPLDRLLRVSARARDALSWPGVRSRVTPLDARLPAYLAVFVFATAGLLSFTVLDRMPHIPDAVAYRFQAEQLALGHLTTAAPPDPAAFEHTMLDVKDGRWYGTLPPGWPAVLALGFLVGVPWLINPVLAAVTVLPLHLLVTRMADRGTAHLVTALFALSPWQLFLSASFMNHALSMLLVVSAWLALDLARERGRRSGVWALGAGCLFGALLLVRPFDGLVMGGLAGLGALGLLARRLPWSGVLGLALGAILVSAAILPYNRHLTGDPLLLPFSDYTVRHWDQGSNRLGFGDDIGPPDGWGILDQPGHDLGDAVLNTNQNLYNVNFELFGWGIGSLWLVAVHLLWGRWTGYDRMAALLLLTIPAAHAFYWFSGGPDFGARYWYLALFPLLWVSVRGIRTLVGMRGDPGAIEAAAPQAGLVVAVLCLTSLTVFVPWRAAGKYTEYRDFHAGYRELAASHPLGRSLVLITSDTPSELSSAFFLNRPDLTGDVPVFARDLGPESNLRLREAFSDRPTFLVDGRDQGLRRPRVTAGPLPALRSVGQP